MSVQLTQEISDVMKAVHYRPSVSIILPFETHNNAEQEMRHALEGAIHETEIKLKEIHSPDLVKRVLLKLEQLADQMKFKPAYRSIALFASPVFQKLIYLDIPVEKKIIIDEAFEIRDLVYGFKQTHHYLVLLLSAHGYTIYLGNTSGFTKLLSDKPGSSDRYRHDAAERVANFSDPDSFREIRLDKFLEHVDHALDQVLKVHPIPVFVLGAERIIGHFLKLSKHKAAVINCVRGNYDESTEYELSQLLLPYLADWKKTREKGALQKLENAANEHKLVSGMHDVWKAVMHQKGKLLCIEKNYMYAATQGDHDERLTQLTEPYDPVSYIRDAVDDVISKVLENGGDVEFVEEGVLNEYKHIALIEYY